MPAVHEIQLVGRAYLHAVTVLLQQQRSLHPTAGLFEAADLQWWWRGPRTTDEQPQIFWFVDGAPVAGLVATDWGDGIGLVPIVLPGAGETEVARVVERGVEHLRGLGISEVDLEVDVDDAVMRSVLERHGFRSDDEGASAGGAQPIVEAWMDAVARPATSPLSSGYQLLDRSRTEERPHHMILRGGPDVEARLNQTSLYRRDLDLVVVGPVDVVAAYGLFWFDPVSRTGLVEPMRTEEAHQRRGLARHVLTVGLQLLAEAGAERIKICFEPTNEAARSLYTDVGFEPFRSTVVYTHNLHA